jgi:outer membrane protein assembly factor BamB
MHHACLPTLFCILFTLNTWSIDAPKDLLERSGVKGGLIVHLGASDGKLSHALKAHDGFLVHALNRDAKIVEQLGEHIQEADGYGPVSAEHLSGERLPYADSLVNLIVVEDPQGISQDEMLRVLVPNGVALIRTGDDWKKVVKPWPEDIDEWTHFMHGPDNNAVAKDTRVSSPQRLQWLGGPKWARGHEVLATISAVVSAKGRIFYIADMGPIASVDLPPQWRLIARDAFNGILLWEKEITKWEWTHRPFRSGPTHLPRRLVAIDDTVYFTLGLGEPVSAMDAATGKVKQRYAGTEGTEEVIFYEGIMYVVAGDPKAQEAVDLAVRRGTRQPRIDKRIMAIDSESGKVLWTKADSDTGDLFAQTMAVQGDALVLQNTRAIICLDTKTGAQRWRTTRYASIGRPAWSVPTVVIYKDVVISGDRGGPKNVPTSDPGPQTVNWTVSFSGGNAPLGEIAGYALKDGRKIWSEPCQEGYNAPVDVLISDGLLWTGNYVKARDAGITRGLDPQTGEVKRTRPSDLKYFSPGMSHARCYRNRATDRFLLLGRSGIEFVDVKTGDAEPNHWTRGTCQFGVIPANGMVYVPPHTCACYLKTKLNGFNALAPDPQPASAESAPQLEKGPAFGRVEDRMETTPADWPTFRQNNQRSGSVKTTVSPTLEPAWTTELGGELSALVVAGDILLIARKDTHRLHALDSANGKRRWSFTAGGPVDSPPTIHEGMVVFGSVDGHAYCLRLSDGKLIWRFRAGPEDRRIIIDNHLESAWPVHGNILVQDEAAYFCAGRSVYLDGGIYLYALDPETGAIKHENLFSHRDEETGQQPRERVKGFDMDSGLPDVFSSDGTAVFMRDTKLSFALEPQEATTTHLWSPTGFLDDSWWHRSYWLIGENFQAGWGGWSREGNIVPAGRILCFNEETIFGFGRNMYPKGNAGQWKKGEYYRLYSASARAEPKTTPAPKPGQVEAGKKKRRTKKSAPRSKVNYNWSFEVEPEVRAMVLTENALFTAGALGHTHKSQEAYEGKEGVSLQVFTLNNGTVLKRVALESMPVFDGMAAARGRLFLATKDGRVHCWK